MPRSCRTCGVLAAVTCRLVRVCAAGDRAGRGRSQSLRPKRRRHRATAAARSRRSSSPRCRSPARRAGPASPRARVAFYNPNDTPHQWITGGGVVWTSRGTKGIAAFHKMASTSRPLPAQRHGLVPRPGEPLLRHRRGGRRPGRRAVAAGQAAQPQGDRDLPGVHQRLRRGALPARHARRADRRGSGRAALADPAAAGRPARQHAVGDRPGVHLRHHRQPHPAAARGGDRCDLDVRLRRARRQLRPRQADGRRARLFPARPSAPCSRRARSSAAPTATSPYYDLCLFGASADLRGYETGRYRDRASWALQGEVRHQFTDRWGGVAFLGLGGIAPSAGDLVDEGNLLPAGGIGVRYRPFKSNDVQLRVDLAVGKNDHGALCRDRRGVLGRAVALPCQIRVASRERVGFSGVDMRSVTMKWRCWPAARPCWRLSAPAVAQETPRATAYESVAQWPDWSGVWSPGVGGRLAHHGDAAQADARGAGAGRRVRGRQGARREPADPGGQLRAQRHAGDHAAAVSDRVHLLARPGEHPDRDLQRDPPHLRRRPPAARGSRPVLQRPFGRPLGRRYAGGRHDRDQPDGQRRSRPARDREHALSRAHHPRRARPAGRRDHDHRSRRCSPSPT